MKRLFSVLLVLVTVHGFSLSPTKTLVEKKSRAETTVKIGKPPKKKSHGPRGPSGPPGEPSSQAYATALDANSPEFLPPAVSPMIITVPFSSMPTGEEILFNNAEDSFTLPKGVYSAHFQFTIGTEINQGVTEMHPRAIYLHLAQGESSLKIPLTWSTSITKWFSDPNTHPSLSVSGATIFSVPNDETVVTLMMETSAPTYVFFNKDPNPDQTSTENHTTRIVFKKIDSV